ncbi:MAG TPA: phosphate-starvation-inducible PsiE family protein [Chloroflexota bacterium]|nr:phosphate-starvation-inducible PsiE family protein [Chloroflexota bacterium]
MRTHLVEQIVPHTEVHRLSRRFLEPTQDLLVLGLSLALFALMFRTLAGLFAELFAPNIDFRLIIAEVLFVLVMVEVVRLLIVYLREHRVAVDFMIELGIVSTLREVVLRGVVELHWLQLAAVALFLLTLGALLRFGGLRLHRPAAAEELFPTLAADSVPESHR